jgi:hypothetical protein
MAIMKPWQTPIIKVPNKGVKRRTKKRGPKSEPKGQNLKQVTKGAKE